METVHDKTNQIEMLNHDKRSGREFSLTPKHWNKCMTKETKMKILTNTNVVAGNLV